MLRKIADNFEELLGAVILAIMAVITALNVITRYAVTYPLAFTEEITVSLFVWVVLLGTSMAFKKSSNLAMTFLYNLMPLSARKLCFYLGTLLSIVFFALLIWLGSRQVLEEIALDVTTDSLAIPAASYSIGVPLFSLLIIVRIIQSARKTAAENSF